MSTEDEFRRALDDLEDCLIADKPARDLHNKVVLLALEMRYEAHSAGFEEGWQECGRHMEIQLQSIENNIKKIRGTLR